MDWFANGLPREGNRANSPQIGDLVRRAVPVCHLGDRVGEVLQRVQTAGWDQCVVVNSAGGVLGLLRGEALHAAPEAGYTHVWVHQIGPDQAGFFQFYAHEVLPKLQ